MAISQTSNTITNLQSETDEVPFIIGRSSRKLKVALGFDAESDRTQQEFKQECDINGIMARYQKTGMIDFVNRHPAQYEDCTGYDFQEAMQTVATAQSMFADLPATMRDRFKNDPAEFLNFVSDEKNREEAAKMGLLAPEKAAAILNPPPASESAPAPSNPSAPDGSAD